MRLGMAGGVKRLASALMIALMWTLPLAAEQDDDPEHLPYWESEQDLDAARESGEISEELSDELKVLVENPLDLNRAKPDELSVLPGIGAEEARRIVTEREENGEYSQPKDLLERGVLALDAYQKIRMFVTAVPAASWLRTTGELRQEIDTSPYNPTQTGESVSSLNARTRIKGMDAGARFRAGGTFLMDHRTLSQGFGPDRELKVVRVRDARWVKSYAGFDPARGRGLRGVPFLKQLYTGHFRAGFFDGVAREMPARFLPDERMGEPGAIEIHPDRRRAAPLRGLAAQLSAGSVKVSAFHSDNHYPTPLPLAAEGALDVSSAVVDDALHLQISAVHAAVPVLEASSLEAFWQSQSSERRFLARPEPALRRQAAGAAIKHVFDDGLVRILYSRMDRPLPGREDPNFFFARGEYQPPLGPRWTASYKKLGRGYYNPAGSLFTGSYLWQASVRANQELGSSARLRLDYSESEKFVSDLAVRRQEAAFYLRWDLDNNVALQWGERYRSPGPISVSRTFTEDGTLKSARMDAPDELRSSLRVSHKPGRNVETRLGYDLLTRKEEAEPRIDAGQYLTASLRWKTLEELEVLGQADFNDPDDAGTNNETQYWTLELRSAPLRNIEVLLRWKNRYRLRMDDADNAVNVEENRADTEDRFSLRVTARW